jgi:hypothetical protein
MCSHPLACILFLCCPRTTTLFAFPAQGLSNENRFARHPTFLYLIYDVIQRRQAALGNFIMVKQKKNWQSVQAAISTLTFDRLTAAAKSVLETGSHNDPTIRRLEGLIQTIASQVPQSFGRMRNMRSHMRALFVCLGMPAFWLTINPADLKNPLVLILAGVDLSCNDLTAEAQRIRHITATMNPVAVAQFFHKICTGVFDVLLAAGTNRSGILGQVSNYFGVVETNGRGMLHLHSLIWLAGNLEFRNLRDRLQNDTAFADRMIHYIKSVIKCSVDLAAENLDDLRARLQPPSAKEPETDSAFMHQLKCDSNAVASKQQMHSKSHSYTCFKNSRNGSRECRFLFPRELVADTHVDRHGVVQLERNNEWVTPWNTTLCSLLRSNHDISFIPTITKALAAVYYITNYATKYDVSKYQLILTAAIVKRAQEDAEAATDPSESQLRIRCQGMNKFALRAFNRLSCEREISGPQAASCLLDLPDYYTLPAKVRHLNLRHLKDRFEYIIMGEPGAFPGQDESVRISIAKKAPLSLFDHYYWRGPSFVDFCLYEYFTLVTINSMKYATSSDIRFLPEHPNYENQIQSYSEKRPTAIYTVALVGSLSENQVLEDSVRGGHPETKAMQDELALILLALLVPWNQLPTIFTVFECADQAYKEHCAEIWNCIKLTLPRHIQNIAENIELLRKSKADYQVDAALRNQARRSALLPQMTDEEEYSDDDNGDESLDDDIEPPETADGSVEPDILRNAFSIVKNRWTDSDYQDAENIPSLFETHSMHLASGMDSAGSRLSDISDGSRFLGTTPDFYNIGPRTLRQWQQRLSATGFEDPSPDFDMDSDEENSEADDEHPLSSEDAGSSDPLFPIIDHAHSWRDPTILERIGRVGLNPTGLSITRLIQETLPLNQQQFLVVKKILDHAIRQHGKMVVGAEDQMLLYVGGEGGTGKSQIIKAVKLGYELLQWKSELLLLGPTGSAAYNIGGRTIHNALSISLGGKPRHNIKPQIYALWKEKRNMIIDEISMVSLKMLNNIHTQCNNIRALQQDSTAILGALPIVVFMGDFHQFAPIKERPLWQTPDSPEARNGQIIWHRFTDVFILDEQMRQQQDLEFQKLLHRARAGSMTAADVKTLNQRVCQSLPLGRGLDCVCVTRSNRLRHHINRLQIRRFAEARTQDIYVFPARHSRTKKVHGCLRIDELLETQDGGNVTGPGLFLYTRDMPITLLYNVCTALGLVNGARGTAAGIVPDPNGEHLICIVGAQSVYCRLCHVVLGQHAN